MLLPLVIVGVVFLLIAIRQIGNFQLQIWQIMLGGAIAVLLTGQIGIVPALRAINLDVMVFLFCMFLLGQALEESGYLEQLAFRFFQRAGSTDALVLMVLFGVGFFSTLLMNDTLAIIGTPVVLLLARQHKMSSKLMLLALCFAVTIGSVMSPIGNPQNLLIAFQIQNPFVTFLKTLFLPTIICLFAAYLLLRLVYAKEFHRESLIHLPKEIKDQRLASLCKISLIVLVSLIGLKILLFFFGVDFRITYLAIISIIPLLFMRDHGIVKRIDWYTLIFFAAMFVLMESVWLAEGALLTSYVSTSKIAILLGAISVSQLVSNVPFVALSIPLLLAAGAGTQQLLTLAVGATLAGNLFILGAASNVIIIQNAERRGETITFWEFARIGIPLTAICVAIYWIFL